MISQLTLAQLRTAAAPKSWLRLLVIVLGIAAILVAIKVVLRPGAPKEDEVGSLLSGVFTPQVQYWSPLIHAWAQAYHVDPNLIATVIQIESCGDPTAVSLAGAQGLFQVMPGHFGAGED